MKTLTIKELAPYVEHDIKGILTPQKEVVTLTGIFVDKFGLHEVQINYNGCYALSRFKPILRPLSSLTEEIDHNGEKFVPIDKLRKMSDAPYSESFRFEEDGFKFTTQVMHSEFGSHQWLDYDFYSNDQYEMYSKLFEWHFDVFGLIDRNLALPIDGKEVEGE